MDSRVDFIFLLGSKLNMLLYFMLYLKISAVGGPKQRRITKEYGSRTAENKKTYSDPFVVWP